MRAPLRILGLAFIASLTGPSALGAEDAAPYQMVRSLQILQDQVAQGNSAAQAAQAALLPQMAELFLNADPDVWRDPKNARAAVIYVLSGGHPQVMRRLLDLGDVAGVEPALLRGALAYVEGRDAEAQALLGAMDVRSLHSSLAGHVALVKASLLIKADPEQAVALLDLARLLLPGTLVEESALRREIASVGDLGDKEKFESLAVQYMRRFQGSAYFASFLQQFSSLFVRLDLAGDPQRFPKLDRMLAELPPDRRRSLYLSIARAALIAGKTATARYSAERAHGLAEPGSHEAQLATLFEAAAMVAGDDLDAGLAKLKSLADAPFVDADAAIREAALSVAEQVRRWPDPVEEPGESESAATNPFLPAIERAQKAITEIDALLGRTSS